MKVVDATIVFQEIPDEVSLAFTISQCPNNCEGCHSSYLKDDIGEELTDDLLAGVIRKHLKSSPITTILFMGGDQFVDEMCSKLKLVKEMFGLKTALYSGRDSVDFSLTNHLDYVKIGQYKEALGGLSSPLTNQKMYQKSSNGLFRDISNKFLK